MQDTQLGRISNFVWGVADDVLRDLYVRGKYRDVILPMTVLRRLDVVLEPTKDEVLKRKELLDGAGITAQEGPLRQAAGQEFYNASPFTLRSLLGTSSCQQLRSNFRGVPGRVLVERAGHTEQLRVPQPDPSGCPLPMRWGL